MPVLDFISPDTVLRHALREHLESGTMWRDEAVQLAEFSFTDQALKAWAARAPLFVVVDDAALKEGAARFGTFLSEQVFSGCLFVLGEAGEAFGDHLVTEVFSKPVRLGHLLARLHFYGRARAQARDEILPIGPWRFMPRHRQLVAVAKDVVVRLTDKEACLLEYLYRTDDVVARDELLAAVWGYDGGVDTHTLETHIYRLRRKLAALAGASVENDAFLVERGGYRINPTWRSA